MANINCRKGDTCVFTVNITGTLDPRYDQARFQVRDAWDATKPTLLSVNETSGITIDHAAAKVVIVIGASATDQLIVPFPRDVAAQLRLYASTDPDDRISWPIQFRLLPEVIDDA